MKKILFFITLILSFISVSQKVKAQLFKDNTAKVSYMEMADVYLKIEKGNFSKALSLVDVLIEHDSLIGVLHYYRGVSQLHLGLNDLAYQSFTKSDELAPEYMEAVYYLGNIHYNYFDTMKNNDSDSLAKIEAVAAKKYFDLYISSHSDIHGKAKQKLKHIYDFLNLPEYKYYSKIEALDQKHISKQAVFPGGELEMYKFIGENISTPWDLMRKGISGRVFTSFIVDEDGTIKEVKIVKGLTPSSNEEVIRVLYSMPKWQPAIDTNGNKVNYVYRMPVKFTINDSRYKKSSKSLSFVELNDEIKETKILMSLKEYEKVQLKTKKILKKYPNNISMLIYSGIAAHNLGNTDLAIKNYLKAYHLQPDNLNVNYNLGTIYVNNVVEYSNKNKAEEKILEEALLAQKHLEQYILSINDEKIISILESLYDISRADISRIDSLKNNLNYIEGITQNPATQPAFPKGNEYLNQFIFNNLVFPIEAMQQAVNGRVYVSFVVEENGNIGQIKVIRGLEHSCDIEVIRLISSMPKWVPAKDEHGNPVKSIYTLPINFRTQ